MEFLTARGLLTAGRATTWRAAAGGFARFADRIARTLTTVRTGLPVRAITCRCGRSPAGAGDHLPVRAISCGRAGAEVRAGAGLPL
jgi:predicted NAD/FAD-binding protein